MVYDIMLERMIAEKPVYKRIVNIIEEPFKGKEKKPRILRLTDPTFKEIMIVDLPIHEEYYHGSTFSVKCNNSCDIKGEVVAHRNDEEIIADKIEKLDCDVTSVHHHPESILAYIEGKDLGIETSHIHFDCGKKSYDHTLEFARFIRGL